MADISLTALDLEDLEAGHGINTLATDGSEHVLYGYEFSADEFAALHAGQSVEATIAGIDCVVSA